MVKDLPVVFSALSDRTRFQVVASLRARELSAGELASRCAVSAPAMSRHLRVLRKAGMIELAQSTNADDARLRVYRLRARPFLSLAEWAEHMQGVWADRLEGFKTYADTRAAASRKLQRGRQK
ncbi:MAG TPA: metalloregulator ArsR/SmtB family transcription factor [Candidatus Baltobacteraceae bacterium]|jgi:DNA-binding transcriptional ArsR family regulator|nr:metalloregulator ArsR/SmtB family transcription factor [Candidatus Baltobacteraceae bacterium]